MKKLLYSRWSKNVISLFPISHDSIFQYYSKTNNLKQRLKINVFSFEKIKSFYVIC